MTFPRPNRLSLRLTAMNTAPSESTAAAVMSSNTSPDVDEPIIIVEYDPVWPWLFEAERQRVQRALGDAATCI